MTRPVIGSTGWGTALNADLDQLEGRIADLETPEGHSATNTVDGVTVQVTRIGRVVQAQFSGENYADTSFVALVPVGYRPSVATRAWGGGEGVVLQLLIATNGTVSGENSSTGDVVFGAGAGTGMWFTSDAEPS